MENNASYCVGEIHKVCNDNHVNGVSMKKDCDCSITLWKEVNGRRMFLQFPATVNENDEAVNNELKHMMENLLMEKLSAKCKGGNANE